MEFVHGGGLDLSELHVQAYNGASNMLGRTRGTVGIITLYLYCASHCLNLAVVKSLQVTSIRNMIGVIERVYWLFSAHSKHQQASQKSIDEAQNVHKLKDLCHTRWIQRPDALSLFQSLHPSTVACMEKISGGDNVQDWSTDFVSDAKTLLLAINTTDFLSALVITNSGLSYIQPLTYNLQAEA